VLWRHALRPSSLTLLTVAGLSMGNLIGGALVVEYLLSIPGLGVLLGEAVLSRQYVALQSLVAIIAIVFVLINFAVDYALHRARSAHPGAVRHEYAATVRRSDEPTEPSKRLPVGAYLAIAWLVLIVGAAIFADFLPLEDPTAEVASLPRMAPGQEGLLLGADNNSRDMLARTIYGARASLTIAVGAVALGFVVGGLLGLLSGYFRNWIGNVLSSLFDILLAIPALVLALSLVAVLKGGGVQDDDAFRLPTIWILIIALGHRVDPAAGPHHPRQHHGLGPA
jgi:ABC-type microcin C transport system permease subunit YejE